MTIVHDFVSPTAAGMPRGAPHAEASASTSAYLDMLSRPMRAVSRFMANRRDLAALAEMQDHELQDIGLVRSDLAEIGGMGGDPLAGLARVAQHRRETYRKTN